MKDFYLRPLWPKYPPFFFILLPWKDLFYNREIILSAMLRQNSKTNMTKNSDTIVKIICDIFSISPTPTRQC